MQIYEFAFYRLEMLGNIVVLLVNLTAVISAPNCVQNVVPDLT